MITNGVLGVTKSMPADPAEHCRALLALFLNEVSCPIVPESRPYLIDTTQ